MKQILKKTISLLVVISMMLSIGIVPFTVTANWTASSTGGYVYISLDVNTLGDGFLYEPMKVPFNAGENWATVTDRFLGTTNYVNTGSLTDSFYMASMKLPRDINVNIPQIILDEIGTPSSGGKNQGELLSQMDYGSGAGWMYTTNNEMASMGASDWFPHDGDVARWQFSVYGWGADLGVDSGWGSPPLFIAADKSELTKLVAEINSASNKSELLAKSGVQIAYNNANAALTNLTVDQATVDSLQYFLDDALNAAPPASSVDISSQLNTTMAYLLSASSTPTFGAEWNVMSLARSGYSVPDGYFDGYFNAVESHIANNNGVLSGNHTEYSRLLIALSSIGRDARDVGGYDLTAWFSSQTRIQQQGINGAIYALLALNTNNYEIPDIDDVRHLTGFASNHVQATRQGMIDYILTQERSGGGWSLSGAADPDITAMALQALAPYRTQTEVSDSIDRALTTLSNLQHSGGGWSSWGSLNSQSSAQVICALTALGVNSATDSRFVKNGNNPLTGTSGLLSFYVIGSGFGNTSNASVNGMSSQQGGYALVAYDRYVKGLNSLYNMSDAFETDPPNQQGMSAQITIEAPDTVMGKEGVTFNAQVLTSAFPTGNYKLLDGIINIPDEFSVENVTVSSRLTGGSLVWNFTDSDKKIRFVYTNTDLNNIGVSGSTFPAELMTISLKVKADIPAATTSVDITVGGATLKESSDSPAFVFDISDAIATIAFSQVGLSVRDLFVGDGIDLIPADKRAIAVTISNSGSATGEIFTYKGTSLIYSPEMTAKQGTETYVLFTTPSESTTDLLNFANYAFSSGAATTVKFGDTDGNDIINAQDALDVISAWLRKTNVTTDMQILQRNVTSDSRINTFDALAIMEYYVSNCEFSIIG